MRKATTAKNILDGVSDTTPTKQPGVYFIERYRDEWQLREDHERLYGIPGGSGFVATFPTRADAEAALLARESRLVGSDARRVQARRAKPRRRSTTADTTV